MDVNSVNNPQILQSNSAPSTPEPVANNIGIPPFVANANNPSRTSSVKGIPSYVLNKLPTPSLVPKPIVIDPVKPESSKDVKTVTMDIIKNDLLKDLKSDIGNIVIDKAKEIKSEKETKSENKTTNEPEKQSIKNTEPNINTISKPEREISKNQQPNINNIIRPNNINSVNHLKSEMKEPKFKSPVDTTPIIIHGEIINRDNIPKISTSTLTDPKNLGLIGRSKNPRYSPKSPEIPTRNNIDNRSSHHEHKSQISSPQFIKGLSPHYTIPGSIREIVQQPNPIPALTFTPLNIENIKTYQIETDTSTPAPRTFSVVDSNNIIGISNNINNNLYTIAPQISTPQLLKSEQLASQMFFDNNINATNNNINSITSPTSRVISTPASKIVSNPASKRIQTPRPMQTYAPEIDDISIPQVEEVLIPEVKQAVTFESRYPIPKFSEMSENDRMYSRVTFEVDFAKLARLYPYLGITKPEPHEPLETLHIKKVKYIKQIYNERTTNNFREYMVLFWACLELFVVKVLGLNASGYTMSQIFRMNQYDAMLDELGEKYSGDVTSSLPVEARLAFWTAVHTFTFVFFNYLGKWLGAPIAGLIRSLIDNLSIGKVVQPVTDAHGNIIMPIPQAREGVQNVQGIPVASAVRGLTGAMLPPVNPAPQNPTPEPAKRSRPKFKEI